MRTSGLITETQQYSLIFFQFSTFNNLHFVIHIGNWKKVQ